jgi:tetratricopeptide (TPR) repeat protein
MSKPPKIDRKTLRNPDEFVKKGQALVSALFDRRVALLSVLGVLLVCILSFYGYQWYMDRHAAESWERYVAITNAPEAERWDKYQKFFTDVHWNRPRYFAAIALGDHYFDEAKKEVLKVTGGDPSKSGALSVEWYTKAMDFAELLPKEKQLVLINRGAVNEMQKKYDDALNDYQKSSELSSDAKAYALLNVARLYALKNDSAKAIQTYEKVTVEFANTDYAKIAKNYIRRLKSPLFQAEGKKG